ncbi:MAG: hypothetical protein QM723_11075 [Myxococcaceae bacterium]
MTATQSKRHKEQQRLERRKEKDAQRAQRKLEKSEKAPRQPGDVDPDIAHIVPGPQPIPEEP